MIFYTYIVVFDLLGLSGRVFLKNIRSVFIQHVKCSDYKIILYGNKTWNNRLVYHAKIHLDNSRAKAISKTIDYFV